MRRMAYLLLIHEPVGQRAERGETAGREVFGRMLAFADSLKQRGVLRGVESLSGLQDSARVSTSGGRAQVMDGPFAEAKEMIGGFFLVDVPTREEAIAIAR